jgi:hypothetical protein
MTELIELLRESPPHRVFFMMLIILVVATVAVYLLERRMSRPKQSDVDHLYYLSRQRKGSEYDIFFEAGRVWRISEKSIEEDFKGFLLHGDIPHYVRHYLRTEGDKKKG